MTNGVTIHHWAMPVKLEGTEHVTRIQFERTRLNAEGRLTSSGERFELSADTVFKAIGQVLDAEALRADFAGLEFQHDRIVVNESGRTSLPNVWAGGDCVDGGDDLTVTAVQHGKVAAIDIDRHLRKG
jgi:glutamate synthase (NADPH/NADH) small chain